MEKKPKIWIETVSADESQLEQVGTVTTASGDKLLKIKTKLAFVNKKNNNNRVYKTEVIKPQVDKLQTRIERRKSVGEVDHPDDNVSRVRNIGVKWDKIWLDESDGWIKGEGTIPNTSMGKELRACYEANIAIGWSMRGRGTLLPGDWQGEQAMIMQSDYLLETFDAVVGESNEGADVEKFWMEQTATSDRCEGLIVCPCAVEKISGQEGGKVLTEAEKTQREKEKEAQVARSKKYGIGIKDGGSVTKPGEFSSIPDDSFLDPVNFAYPADADHVRAAASYWGMPKNQAEYSPAERKIISDRLDKAREKHKIGEYAEEKTSDLPKFVVKEDLLYFKDEQDRPIGHIEKWQGAESNQTTETMKGGDKMEIKDLKLDDLKKDRKDLIEAITAEIKTAVLSEIKEKASDPKYLESIGVKVATPPAAPEVKTDPAIESLKKELETLKTESAASTKLMGELKLQLEASKAKDEALKALEAELKSETYKTTSPAILQVVRKNLLPLVSDSRNVKEQVAIAIGLATTLEKQTTDGKGFTTLGDPEKDGGIPAPVSEKKINPISGLTTEQEHKTQDRLGMKPKPVTETKPA